MDCPSGRETLSRHPGFIRWIVALVFVSVMCGPLPAALAGEPQVRYEDTGYDPDDRPIDETSCCQQDPDIRASTRKIWVDRLGHGLLTINFRAFEYLRGYWTVIARLDSRGGPRADYRMKLYERGDGPIFCWTISRRSSSRQHGEARWLPNSAASAVGAACDVPLRFIRRDKRIRWWLFSPLGFEGKESRIDEFAPDRGWYV